MGRALQNTMVNLALENACDEAMYQVKGAPLVFAVMAAPALRSGVTDRNASSL